MSLVSGTRIEVRRGNPTAEEVVAILLASDQAAPAGVPTAPGSPGWQRAARLEGLGGAPLSSANDPRLRGKRALTGR